MKTSRVLRTEVTLQLLFVAAMAGSTMWWCISALA